MGEKSTQQTTMMLSSSHRGVVTVAVAMIVLYLLFSGNSMGRESEQRSHQHLLHAKTFAKSLTESEIHEFPPDAFSYIAMIDAGSSGCRAHIYRYGLLGDSNGPLYILPAHESLKVKPGLSSFKDDPTEAGKSLTGLINFMKSNIPQSHWASTPIHLKATAGLRLVSHSQREAILKSVRQYLGDSKHNPFSFHPSNAQVISGIEEGAFGWIAVNYLKNTLGPFKPTITVDKESATAVIEMGGASTQVTQVAKTREDEISIESGYKYTFTAQDESFTLYSHSYLGYGAEKAREALNSHLAGHSPPSATIKDPCLNPGYVLEKGTAPQSTYEGQTRHSTHGSGSGDSCHQAVEEVMFSNRHGAANEKCKKSSSSVSFDCIYQPSYVRSSKNILVFENFFYIASAVGTMPAGHESNPEMKSEFPLQTSPKEFLDSANEVCSVPWGDMEVRFPKEKSQNARWCFSTTYAYLFLTHGIGLGDDQPITVQQSIGKAEIEWALGATYKELSDELAAFRKH